jgi:uncharacterized membrane protein
MKGQLAYGVSGDSRWGFEVKGRLDDAEKWQARSVIACQDATPKIQKKLIALALSLLLGFPGLARADFTFNFTTIDVPGASRTAANANSTNAIAGEYDDAGGITHGFILRGGVYTTFNASAPNDVVSSTVINGINAAGRLAGTYMGTSRSHAFFWSQGVLTTLDPSGSTRSQGGFLNAQDQVVGTYRDANDKRHGFLWSKGNFTTFNVPDDHPLFGTVALGINDPGQIVGDYVDTDGNRHGFLLSQGTYTTLDVPGAMLTVAQGINNASLIVGLYVDAEGNEHGFVLSQGVYTKVDVPKSASTAVFSVNAQGETVGPYDDASGSHGFVGTPAR